jgi:hypothetical protein
MQVGSYALYFPDRASAANLDKKVAKYIAFVRKQERGQPVGFTVGIPSNGSEIISETALLRKRFYDLRARYRGELNEIRPPLIKLVNDVAALVAKHQLPWPDFSWDWDPSLPLMGMLLGLTAGPLTRASLPAHLEFPPADLPQTISKQQFYDLVGDFLLNLPERPPPMRQSSSVTPLARAERYFHRLAVEATFANLISVTASYGLHFKLENNFELVDDNAMGNPRPKVKFMSRHAAREFPSALLQAIGLDLDKNNWPVV